MEWMPIDTAPRDGTPVAYIWAGQAVSTCLWLCDADEPGWWDIRGEEPAIPTHWCPIVLPMAGARTPRARVLKDERLSSALNRSRG